ncbi:hypothetical protein ONZ45_g3691 [Pleurotus djamor]|nr:hypothetical protein ONZ45_g3691 [Pleurotus djamor]
MMIDEDHDSNRSPSAFSRTNTANCLILSSLSLARRLSPAVNFKCSLHSLIHVHLAESLPCSLSAPLVSMTPTLGVIDGDEDVTGTEGGPTILLSLSFPRIGASESTDRNANLKIISGDNSTDETVCVDGDDEMARVCKRSPI